MLTVHDVAAYILRKLGPLSAMKLQKLVYYSQAWSLVWDDRQLFRARFEAWANGPVCPELFRHHKGVFKLSRWELGDPKKVEADPEAKGTIDGVLKFYAQKSPQWLSDLTHAERPWLDARRGVAPGERCGREIKPAEMAEYYGSL